MYAFSAEVFAALIFFGFRFRAKSNLPIKKMLAMLTNKEADTVSCSRDDTNYSFFASQHRDVISIKIKKLGEENIEFEVPSNKLRKEVCLQNSRVPKM